MECTYFTVMCCFKLTLISMCTIRANTIEQKQAVYESSYFASMCCFRYFTVWFLQLQNWTKLACSAHNWSSLGCLVTFCSNVSPQISSHFVSGLWSWKTGGMQITGCLCTVWSPVSHVLVSHVPRPLTKTLTASDANCTIFANICMLRKLVPGLSFQCNVIS